MEPEQPTADQNSKKPLAVEMDSEKDHFLQDLVFQTNVFPDNDTPITLLVGGVFVSGIIIAGDEYFRLTADLTSSEGKVFHKHVLAFGTGYTEDRAANKVNEEPTFIHYKGVYLLSRVRPDEAEECMEGQNISNRRLFYGNAE